MAEALLAVFDWIFGNHGVAKIVATADIVNVRSWRVMEKVGMTREATLRSHIVATDDPNRWEDTVYYGILREEWENR